MSTPLRILLTNSGRRWIGEVGHCALLYEALTAAGHYVVLGCRKDSELERYARAKGFNMLSLAYASQPRPSDWTDLKMQERCIREQRIDLIHVHRGKDHWIGTALARRCGIPLVRTRHVVTPAAQHLLNRWLYARGTQALISVSLAAERSLGALAGLPSIRAVIHSAVDQEKFRPERRSEAWRREAQGEGAIDDPLWIGLIARIQRIKGQRPFLSAAVRAAAEVPEARFFLAGRKGEKYNRVFNRFVARQGYKGHVRVEGMLEDLPKVMASFDVGVVASLGSEGMSRVTLEYMASGVPVVATRVGAIPELLEPEGEEPLGIVVPPGDVEAMAAALIGLARDPERRRRLAARGLESVRRRHTVGVWLGATEAVYRRALAAAK